MSLTVSTVMITYNHEQYIKEAIEGILMQECNFKIELIIADDTSPDNTKLIVDDIIRNHERGHWIKYTRHPINKGMMHNFIWALDQTKGKYIALCEGDDYWIDPYKLQKQVDFLEKNEEYGLVHGDCDFYFQDKGTWERNANRSLSNNLNITDKEELFFRLVNGDYKVRTATALFRKSLLVSNIEVNVNFLMGDTPMWLDFSQETKFKYIDEVFCVYRILKNSASRSSNKSKQSRFGLSMAEIRIFYSEKHGYPIKAKLKKRYNNSLLTYKLYNPTYNELYPLYGPTILQQIKIKFSRFFLFRFFFKLEKLTRFYAKTILNKFQ